MTKKRRKRGMSLDAEIKKAAKQIYESGMADAYKSAALSIVGRKLDEIKAILQAAGLQGAMGAGNHAPAPQAAPQRPAPRPDGPVCTHCGLPAVRRAKPNRFIVGPPPWYCLVHAGIAGKIEAEDALDGALIGATGPQIKPKQPMVHVTNAPAKMVEQAVPEPVHEGSPSDGLAEALKGLGVEVE